MAGSQAWLEFNDHADGLLRRQEIKARSNLSVDCYDRLMNFIALVHVNIQYVRLHSSVARLVHQGLLEFFLFRSIGRPINLIWDRYS